MTFVYENDYINLFKKYRFVACFYETFNQTKYINPDVISASWSFDNTVYNLQSIDNKTINAFIKTNHLNTYICKTLKHNACLRFLIIEGIHECIAKQILMRDNNIYIKSDIDNCNFPPNSNSKVTALQFTNISNCNLPIFPNEDLYIDGLKFNFQSDTSIGIEILLNNRGSELKSYEITFDFKNIKFIHLLN